MINQLYILLSFFLAGISIGILFDIFRITRKSFKTPNIITYIEDALFWILTGLIILATTVICTDGEMRLYMILMLITGAFIYFLLVSKYFININVKILKILKSIFRFVTQPLLKILSFIEKHIKFKKFSKK